jgi:hypothetical protein
MLNKQSVVVNLPLLVHSTPKHTTSKHPTHRPFPLSAFLAPGPSDGASLMASAATLQQLPLALAAHHGQLQAAGQGLLEPLVALQKQYGAACKDLNTRRATVSGWGWGSTPECRPWFVTGWHTDEARCEGGTPCCMC